jgi:hypothetical protein
MDKLTLLRQRRERWSRQKEIAQMTAAAPPSTTPLAPQNDATAPHNNRRPPHNNDASHNAKVLNSLTEKIARRLRSELENDPEVIQNRSRNKLNAQQQLKKQSQVASQYQCGICFELLLGKRRPKIIVPCGHTFCELCIDHHVKVNPKAVCPFCRSSINSMVINHHLRQLVETYAAEHQVGMPGHDGGSGTTTNSNNNRTTNQDNGAGGGGMAGARYLREYNMLKTRRRILRQEQTESKQEMARLDSAYRLHVTEEQRIRMEEQQAALDVEAAKKRLARIRNRLEEQHSLTSSVKDQKDLADTKLNMIKSTLATICQQADKAGVLASAAAAEVQQNGGGGGGRS